MSTLDRFWNSDPRYHSPITITICFLQGFDMYHLDHDRWHLTLRGGQSYIIHNDTKVKIERSYHRFRRDGYPLVINIMLPLPMNTSTLNRDQEETAQQVLITNNKKKLLLL